MESPADRTEFVGRQTELDAVTSLMASSRIVTIAGPGGSGKSRLATEMLRRNETDGDSWLVRLSPADSSRGVVEAVTGALGLLTSEGSDGLNGLRDYLAPRRSLIVLDNCEHVPDDVRDLVDSLLTVAPGLTVVTTSRMSLGITGERVYRLPSMATAEAAELFRTRAIAARHDLVFDDAAHELVRQMCERLAGMPLGIEIAAARLRSVSLRDLNDAVLSTLTAPTPGAASASDRHLTLRTTIEWSHRHLDDAQQDLFCRLAVFDDTFDLTATRAIADELGDVVDLIDALVDRSLVEATPQSSGGLRYRLLEPVKEFAREQLVIRDATDRHTTAHANHFAALVADADPHLRGPDQVSWRDRLLADNANLGTALARLLEAGRVEDHLRMCAALVGYWRWTGRHDFGRHALLDGLGAADHSIDPVLVTRGWYGAWELTTILDAATALEYAERGLEAAERSEDDYSIGRMQLAHAQARFNAALTTDTAEAGLDSGRTLLAESTSWWTDPDWDDANVAWSSAIYAVHDPVERRRRAYGDAIDRLRELGDGVMLTTALAHSVFFIGEGFDDWVRLRLAEAIEVGRRIDHRAQLGHALLYLGSLNRFSGRHGDAVSPLVEAADLLDDIGDLDCATSARIHLALVDDDTAATDRRLISAANDLLRIRARRVEGELAIAAVGRAVDVGDLDAAAHFAGWASGFEHAGSESTVLRGLLARLQEAGDAGALAAHMKVGSQWTRREGLRAAIDWLSAPTPAGQFGSGGALDPPDDRARFVRDGDIWTIVYDGIRTQHRHKKAMQDLAVLLSRPGEEVHVLDLMQAGAQSADLGDVIDEQTRRAYEQRIVELQTDLEVAEDDADLARAERMRIEMDAILEQLSSALGLAGRTRRVSGDAERARSAVTRRIREMIRELADTHPPFADHLTRSIRTGTWCVYDPAERPAWELG